MPQDYLPFSPPLVGEDEIAQVVDTLRSGWITSGPKVRRFETELAERLGVGSSVALSSCTAAMQLALRVMGVGPGDEVIVPAWTFCATANVVRHAGAKPVVVDVEPDTLNIDPEQVERAISPATKAIMPVHFAGHPAEMDRINAIAREHGLRVLEDAAHAIGASWRGVPIGGGGNPTAFSFYATKNLATGEGGLLTGPSEMLDRVRTLALHGMSREAWGRYQRAGSWRYDVAEPGYKFNLSDLHAAIGLAQLGRFDAMQRRRREAAAAYNEAFASHPALETPSTRGGVGHAWHLYVLRLRPGTLSIDRDRFVQEMHDREIGVSVHFIPLPELSAYREGYDLRIEDFPVAHANSGRAMSLPIHGGLSEENQTRVIEAVLEIAHRFARRGAVA